MAYIGTKPTIGNFQICDAISVVNGQAAYTMQVGGGNVSPQSSNHMIVSLNGTIQKPNSSYTVANSVITFSSNLATGDVIDFIQILGDVLDLGVPSDATVTKTKLGTDIPLAIWESSIKTSAFNASSNKGYWVNTSSIAITVTLPASPTVGDVLEFSDYSRSWGTNAMTLNLNSLKFQGGTSNPVYSSNGQSIRIIYSGTTKGWIPFLDSTVAHTQTYSADFLIIAGGGASGDNPAGYSGGAGGAGGYRNSYSTESSGGGGSSETSLTLTVGTQYTVTVGAGGSASNNSPGGNGNNSSISGSNITTITSIGGGGGGEGNSGSPDKDGKDGGSGGSGASNPGSTQGTAGSGTSNQGFNAGTSNGSSDDALQSGGGGGAGSAGGNGTSSTGGGGGSGLASSITGSSVTRGGGGAGGSFNQNVGSPGSGGGGSAGSAGTANTGGGGGAASTSGNNGDPGNGGSGVVIIRIATANYSGTTTGNPTVSTSGSDTILTFNSSGSFTA